MNDLREAAKKVFRLSANGVANYGWLKKDGSYEHSGVNVCHAGLRRKAPYNSVAVISQVKFNRLGNLSEDIAKEFYQWMLNDSPLARVYITKDVDQAFNDQFILLDVEQPSNVMMAAAILHRHIWEEIKVPRVWHDLVAAGIDGNGAFILSHLVGVGYGPYDGLEDKKVYLSFFSNNSNHTLFDGHLEIGTLTNFKRSNFVNAAKLPITKNFNMNDCVGNLFQTNDSHVSFMKMVSNIFKEDEKASGHTNNNPFATTSKTPTSVYRAYPKLIESLAKHYPQICEEDEKCAAK